MSIHSIVLLTPSCTPMIRDGATRRGWSAECRRDSRIHRRWIATVADVVGCRLVLQLSHHLGRRTVRHQNGPEIDEEIAHRGSGHEGAQSLLAELAPAPTPSQSRKDGDQQDQQDERLQPADPGIWRRRPLEADRQFVRLCDRVWRTEAHRSRIRSRTPSSDSRRTPRLHLIEHASSRASWGDLRVAFRRGLGVAP